MIFSSLMTYPAAVETCFQLETNQSAMNFNVCVGDLITGRIEDDPAADPQRQNGTHSAGAEQRKWLLPGHLPLQRSDGPADGRRQVRVLRSSSRAPSRTAYIHAVHDQGLPAAQALRGAVERHHLRVRLSRYVPADVQAHVERILCPIPQGDSHHA